ncbi:ADP-ribosylglycohydrolase family protein [Microseira wollei]|uniref:ADP-ribosylation/Crystallin J1 n=1 Tax=Microseira wollei NIES-4236 TaxID=2530354 RepID=A0AAV3XH83_9CYAN|nr:ADP-ribosylglycohydrolase family protein [Microseira wollei]GET41779.1 ADP-ribosylation/Crystallin J1 [Microseira wollei NIES-4236]
MISPTCESIIGCLLGTAVGDAFGLPYEGLSKRRQVRLYPHLNQYQFLFGRGMISDDTEHTCTVAQSLIVSAGNVDIFKQDLAWGLRFWLLGLPAGIGYGTLRGILKLWLGYCSGVFSAGNGAAMRSAIIGVCYGDDLRKLRQLVRASTRLTHTDPKAEFGALAVAFASYLSSRKSQVYPQNYYCQLANILGAEAAEFLELIEKACYSADAGESTAYFASQLGMNNRVSGYVYDTVPVVIQTWLRHQQDYPTAIREIIRCGRDTDTTAAILGGIIGASVGKEGIPTAWLQGLWEWPRTKVWIELLGKRLADVCKQGAAKRALSLPMPVILLRNLLFLIVVIVHGFRRFLPPY